MGGKPSGGGGVRYVLSSEPTKPAVEHKKVREEKSRSMYAGAQKRKEEEALTARKKLLGE